MKKDAIRIGPHFVGRDYPPLMIAEISANHCGSLDRALRILHEAADNGAQAIKLQTFTACTLTIDSHKPEFFIDDEESLWHGRRLWELYKEAETPWEWHSPLFEAARKRDMACISSAFDQSSIDFLIKLGVDAIKIASFELIHIPLIEGAAKSGLPIILSTGMASIDEIENATVTLRSNNCEQFILLRCTSAYPSEEKDTNAISILDMQDRFSCQVGLSDHSLNPYSAYAAVALGATVIEKHLTLSRMDGGLDANFSMEPADLKETTEGIKKVWLSRGAVRYGTQLVEETSRKERPSIYVVRSIAAGELFTKENIRIIRPGYGLPPKDFLRILGRKAVTDISAETSLKRTMIDGIF